MSELIMNNPPDVRFGASRRAGGVTFTPRFDVWENDDAFILAGDLPGVAPENLEIHYENQELRIWGSVAPREGAEYWSQEYGVGDFFRSFTLGEAIDAEGITADLSHGVLTITAPKKAEARPRRIAVRAS